MPLARAAAETVCSQAPLVSAIVLNQLLGPPALKYALRAAREDGRLPGVRLEADTGRSYPERGAAAPIIGFAGVDNVGLTGIEYMFSGELLPSHDDTDAARQALAA